MQIRDILNIIKEAENPSDKPAPSSGYDTPTSSSLPSKEKTMPGGYKGSGQMIGNELVTNLDSYKQLTSPEGQAAMQKITKKDGTLRMNIPIELQRQVGMDDTKPHTLDAPWRYEGGGTGVQLPSGSYVSGSWHKGFHDPNAPADVLPIPPLDQLADKDEMKADRAMSFLIKTGHDDASIKRSMKHYFPHLSDKAIDNNINSTREFFANRGRSKDPYAIDSPHDHKKNILGAVRHPGAIAKIDPEAYEASVNQLVNLGQDRKLAANAIKSAYKNKSGATVAHAYYELDPKMFEKGAPFFYELQGQYKVGDFTVYHQPETDDEGRPTGKETVVAMRLGKYYRGGKLNYNDVTSYWHGTKQQWEKDKKEFLSHLKNTKSDFSTD